MEDIQSSHIDLHVKDEVIFIPCYRPSRRQAHPVTQIYVCVNTLFFISDKNKVFMNY